jgi:hypothetical protein
VTHSDHELCLELRLCPSIFQDAGEWPAVRAFVLDKMAAKLDADVSKYHEEHR